MFQTTNNNDLSTQINQDKKKQDISNNINDIDSASSDKIIENLSTITYLFKSKKAELTKLKKSISIEAKKSNFIKTKSFKIDFFTFRIKQAFIYHKMPLPKY